MTATALEIASQPEVWARSLDLLGPARTALVAPGERVLALGCGTSWFVAQSYAQLRERAGFGETDAVCASEYHPGRRYDRVVAFCRSGTTTEVLGALAALPSGTHRVVLTAVDGEPIDAHADERLLLDFADETSVVQTRFPTTVLALARAALGDPVDRLLADGAAALAAPLPAAPEAVGHTVFLGTGWSVGLANEAALKVREAAQAWSEAYPAMDFRHGPVAVCGPRSLVFAFGALPAGLADDVAGAQATLYRSDLDPLAQLVLAQRFAVALAAHRGLDPDRPRLLTRSVILPGSDRC
jgi:glucosamine--fructose-6-phosphate aminotransferase (isomerizing)